MAFERGSLHGRPPNVFLPSVVTYRADVTSGISIVSTLKVSLPVVVPHTITEANSSVTSNSALATQTNNN